MTTAILWRQTGLVAGLLAGVSAGVAALYQLTDALGRVCLFLFVYHAETGVNHSDEFADMYRQDAWAIPLGLLAALLLWRQGMSLRRFGAVVFLANVLGLVAYLVMHRTGVLVTYDEFIQRWGHSR